MVRSFLKHTINRIHQEGMTVILNRCCRIYPWHRRWYYHRAVQATGTAALIFTGMVLCALILTYGPGQFVWSAAEQEKTVVADWGP